MNTHGIDHGVEPAGGANPCINRPSLNIACSAVAGCAVERR
jgi:hypothetical protein